MSPDTGLEPERYVQWCPVHLGQDPVGTGAPAHPQALGWGVCARTHSVPCLLELHV